MVYTLYFYIILSGRKVIETNNKLNNNVKIANNEGQIQFHPHLSGSESLSLIPGVSETQQSPGHCEPLERILRIGDEVKHEEKSNCGQKGVKERDEWKSPQRNLFLRVLHSRVQIPPFIH